MRGPRDERIGRMGMGIAEAIEPDGGKVLERLHLFNIERGFERDEAPASPSASALPWSSPQPSNHRPRPT